MARRDRDFSFSIEGDQEQERRSSARSDRGRWKRPSELPWGKIFRDALLVAMLSFTIRWVFSSGFSAPQAPDKKPTLVEIGLVESGMPVLSSCHGSAMAAGPALIIFYVPSQLCELADTRCVANLFRKFDWTTSVRDQDGVEPGLDIEMAYGSNTRCVGKAQMQPEGVAWPSMYGITDNRETTGGAVWQFSYACSR